MPYIITTKRPDERPSRVGHADDQRVTSRRAVATPEEATRVLRDAISRATRGLNTGATVRNDDDTPRTVGPLPDGTVIEVEHARWDHLREIALLAGFGPIVRDIGDGGQPIVDAYNAAQS
jgi:hypothetical protein